MSNSYQQKVDNAYDTFKTEGAEKVERALDTLQSVGINMQNHMIAKARKLFDVWNLSGLSGVPDKTPYSYISPTGWCEPDADDEGWQTLTVTHKDYNSQSSFHSSSFVDGHFKSDQSSSSGGGGVNILASALMVPPRPLRRAGRTPTSPRLELNTSFTMMPRTSRSLLAMHCARSIAHGWSVIFST